MIIDSCFLHRSSARIHDLHVITETTLTCPTCANAQPATMPVDACQFFYRCHACTQIIRPKPGDCCVFCSYGADV